MSDRFGLKIKENAGKTKYSSLNLNQTYKGTKVEIKTSSGLCFCDSSAVYVFPDFLDLYYINFMFECFLFVGNLICFQFPCSVLCENFLPEFPVASMPWWRNNISV